jgi:hypothetical protein
VREVTRLLEEIHRIYLKPDRREHYEQIKALLERPCLENADNRGWIADRMIEWFNLVDNPPKGKAKEWRYRIAFFLRFYPLLIGRTRPLTSERVLKIFIERREIIAGFVGGKPEDYYGIMRAAYFETPCPVFRLSPKQEKLVSQIQDCKTNAEKNGRNWAEHDLKRLERKIYLLYLKSLPAPKTLTEGFKRYTQAAIDTPLYDKTQALYKRFNRRKKLKNEMCDEIKRRANWAMPLLMKSGIVATILKIPNAFVGAELAMGGLYLATFLVVVFAVGVRIWARRKLSHIEQWVLTEESI